MSQEEILINVHLEQKGKKDYLVFEFDDPKKVCLNEENSQNQLKQVFSILLSELMQHPIKLQYTENKEYKVGLYKDVCKEYIKDLNREISRIRKKMPEKFDELNIRIK